MRSRPINRLYLICAIAFGIALPLAAQDTQPVAARREPQQSHAKYFDERTGKTADELVKVAIANNLEVVAMRKESEAGE